ncbi:MAG: hypothetical protein V3S46_00885 [Nitrospinota bacterium]
MSARIKEILEVMKEVREQYHNKKGQYSIEQLRRIATRSVADQQVPKKIRYSSVHSKYGVQLKPEVKGSYEFDSHLEKWLLGKPNELKNILLLHKCDYQDEGLINDFFDKVTETEFFYHKNLAITRMENFFSPAFWFLHGDTFSWWGGHSCLPFAASRRRYCRLWRQRQARLPVPPFLNLTILESR